ncbi:hypothetical protein DFH06DRAFT_1322030 [Mycena polygramma]|nr:hypothetical protein DFH06DRAFT_1322030 [Mycena polygramma]
MQYNLRTFASEVRMRQVAFMYSYPGVEFFTVFDLTYSGDLDGIPDWQWIDVIPVKNYGVPEMPLRLEQLARSGNRMQLHAVLIHRRPEPVLRMFPVWSNSSQELDGLSRIARNLPPGHDFWEIYPEAVLQLQEHHMDREVAGMLQIY